MPSTFYTSLFWSAGWQARRAVNAACGPLGNTPATTVAHYAPARALPTGQRIGAPLRDFNPFLSQLKGAAILCV